MTQTYQVVDVPFYPGPSGQGRELGTLGPGMDVSFRIDVPVTARVGSKGSCEIYPWPNQISKAAVTFATSPGVNDESTYGMAERSFFFVVEGPEGNPVAPAGMQGLRQGGTYYINVTLSHNGKQGKPYGGDPTPRTIACEFRTPQ